MNKTAVSCSIFFATVAVAGAQQVPPQAPIFGETVEVRVVNLEVVVTDRDGLPVTGLPVADFKLLVDGQEEPIRFFSEVRGGTAVDLPPGGAAAGGIAGMPDLVPGSPVATSYLVFVDDYFSISRDRDRVLEGMVEDLGRLNPEDRMAVVAYDGREISMLSSWSSSTEELGRVLRKARDRPALGLQRTAERRSFLDDVRAERRSGIAQRVDPGTQLTVSERFYAEQLEDQVENVVSAVSSTLRGFANPPGRKVLVLLSGGWPYDLVEYVTRQSGRLVVEPSLARGDRLYSPLVETANRLGYTIYAVDVPGFGESGGADFGGADFFDAADQAAEFLRENNAQYALEYVSRRTGGRALVNVARMDALERAATDTRTYYWLGFVPTWKGDDSRHRVEVELRREGLRVRSRAGYLDLSRRQEITMAVESILMFGGGANTQPMSLTLGLPQKVSARKMRVAAKLSLPVDGLTLIPAGGERLAELELRIAALDDEGGRSEIPVLPVRLAIPGEPRPGQVATYETTLELRRTYNRILFALYDPLTGTIWTATGEARP